MSLSKSFFHAGAKSAIVSLWPVDDCATSAIMKYFYKYLNLGERKDQALRNAKIEYRTSVDSDHNHPYYWAGFIVIGDCSPVWPTTTCNSAKIIIILAVIALLLLLIMYARRKQ